MPYGFDINVGGDMLQEMQKMYNAMQNLTQQVAKGQQDIQRHFRDTSETIRDVGSRIVEAFAIERLWEFGKELAHLTAEFEGFQNVIRYSSRSTIDAADNLSYIESAIKRLHLPMEEAMRGFSEMQAGLIGTGIEGQKLRNLFEGIATASTVLHLGANAQEMILYDFKEIGERGLNMRNMRSLMGWLPGVSEIVKETFHKSFQELEKEHMTGPTFLSGLAGGLQKHFAPGLNNAGNSLMAAMNDMNTAVTKLKLELGENLRPLFIEIMNDIKKAFDSAPMKYFVAHVREIASTVMTLIKLWLEYNAGIKLANIVQEAWIAIQSAMALAAGKTTIAIDGAKVSLDSFQESLGRFNTGLFAMGIASAIELLMKFREHAKKAQQAYDDMLEEVSGANAMAGTVNGQQTPIGNIKAAMADTTLMKDQTYKDDLLVRAQNNLKEFQQYAVEAIKPTVDSLSARVDSVNADPFMRPEDKKDVNNKLTQDKNIQALAKQNIETMKQLIEELRRRGARTPNYGGGGGGASGNAFSTASLAGASGGLGEAKQVIINFHAPFQENIVPNKDMLKAKGNEAIQAMLRMLNNVALSQSTTQ